MSKLLPLALLLGALTPSLATEDRPSVLVHCARPSVDQWYWWVDLRYLAELHAKGFEVDYTDRHSDFSWERVRHYDVLVIYTVPLERGEYYDNSPDAPPYRDEFIAIVERFLEEGGGVLLLARSLNADESFLPLIARWGARIPHERIVERDPQNLAPLPRMRGVEKLWFTDNVPPSPVADGVRQVWLPLTAQYGGAETMPIEVDDSWTVVLRGGATSTTEPIDLSRSPMLPPPDRRVRAAGVSAPPLFAIRDYAAGRIAFGASWPQYSIGQGTEWLYERRVLSEGVGGRPSQFGRLLENVLGWLAERRVASGAVSGFATDPERLVPPNERAGVRARFVDASKRSARDPLARLAAARRGPPVRGGLIGAESEWGAGAGSVADWARAAREGGLAFVVFLEDFAALDVGKLARLREACARESGEDLRLWPGYRIETNTGNTMFLYGDGVELPPPGLVVAGLLNLQYRDPGTGEPSTASPFIDWINYRLFASRQVNVGYLGFAGRDRAMAMVDLRFYSVVALRLYRDGTLLEENFAAYLETAAGTIPPVPVAVNFVASPAALARSARAAAGLTYVEAETVAGLWDALGYADQYRAPGVFVSDGPTIHGFADAFQYYTFAAERFVADAARAAVPIVVRSASGLAEIAIYDGERLFRRFLPGEATSFEEVLELPASVQRTLVLVAKDVAGRTAVANAWRGWKGGDLAPLFCGDRVNDCRDPALMAKGPGIVQVAVAPEIVAGHTWDGGPPGVRPLLRMTDANRPALVSSLGQEGERGFANRPLLEFADEGAVRVRSLLDRVYAEDVPVVNPWHTFGPLGGPSRLLRAEVTFTLFNRAIVGPHPDMWPGLARRAGAAVSLFEEEITFRASQRVQSLRLFRQEGYPGPFPVFLVHGRGRKAERVVDLSPGRRADGETLRFPTGDWIGIYGPEATNLAVLWNRGAAIRIVFRGGPQALALQFFADTAGVEVRAEETLIYELLSIVDPVDAPRAGQERVLEIVRYLSEPDGLRARRGTVGAATGLVEATAVEGAASFRLTRPADSAGIPLPVRVSGLNPNWSAGVAQASGNRYRAAGFDREGRVYETLFPDLPHETDVTIGNPVVSDREELRIQVTLRDDRGLPSSWHVSVNNPTDGDVQATFRTAMDLPGLALDGAPRTIPAGGYVVLPVSSGTP